MPAKRKSTERKNSANHQPPVDPCEICGAVMSRRSDIKRHMEVHDNNTAKKFQCPWEDCDFSAHQKSNFDTHYRRHERYKPCICTDDPNCHFQVCDPASLLRHRKNQHGYIPAARKPKSKAPTNSSGHWQSSFPASTSQLPSTSSPSNHFPFEESSSESVPPTSNLQTISEFKFLAAEIKLLATEPEIAQWFDSIC